jgi:hypothetical protein
MIKNCKVICAKTYRDKLNLIWIYRIAFLIFLGLMYVPSAGAGDIQIFSNSNKNTVYNLKTTTFQLTQPMVITKIETYHWNDQKGTSGPGKVGIRGIGYWQAKASNGMYNTPNTYWTVYPNIRLEPGSYSITDSDPATWSQNSGSGGLGFVRIYGRSVGEVSSTTTSTPTTSTQTAGKSEWNSTFKKISFTQNGKNLSGKYDYAGGRISGTLQGRTFNGWWAENDDTLDCGPNGNWSGPIVFQFSADGRSFTGRYGKCSKGQRTFSSVKSNQTWNGNLLAGSINF